MKLVDKQRLLSRISQYRANKIPYRHLKRRAAVAIIFSENEIGELEFLMIRRSTSKSDPWSGQMAFPGGRVDPGDRGTFDAAKRECQEELSMNLDAFKFIGRLSDRITRKNGRKPPLVITPYVFFAEEKPTLIENYEVASSHWLPLSFFLNQQNRKFRRVRYHRKLINLPFYFCRSCLVWGLSLAMFDELLSVYKSKGKVGRLF